MKFDAGREAKQRRTGNGNAFGARSLLETEHGYCLQNRNAARPRYQNDSTMNHEIIDKSVEKRREIRLETESSSTVKPFWPASHNLHYNL